MAAPSEQSKAGGVCCECGDKDDLVECDCREVFVCSGSGPLAACGEKHREGCPAELAKQLTRAREMHGSASLEAGDAAMALGRVHERRGRGEDAENLYRAALPIAKKHFGDKHAEVAAILQRIGSAMCMQPKKSDKALVPLQDALKIFQKCYGARHPATALAHVDLSRVQQKRGRPDLALRGYEKAAEIYSSHPKAIPQECHLESKVFGLRCVAFQCAKMGYEHYDSAITYLDQALELQNRALEGLLDGDTEDASGKAKVQQLREEIARSELMCARLMDKQWMIDHGPKCGCGRGGEYEICERYERAHDLLSEALGRTSSEAMEAHTDQAKFEVYLDDMENAEDNYMDILESLREKGMDSPDAQTEVAFVYGWIAECQMSNDMFEEALANQKRSLDLLLAVHPDGMHRAVANCRFRQAVCKMRNGKKQGAIASLNEAVRVWDELGERKCQAAMNARRMKRALSKYNR
mmetsp:Transcript_44814/g.112399  ORF Transcript_44814/g.112399 Transcript_44814/m.112399 type:complete len:467 (+) Transcript_44814:140-1540(+)